MYDYLIVGAGLYGAVCAHELTKRSKKVLLVEKRNHIGGNIYTEDNDGIQIHKYGAHIFHTNDKVVWDYINNFSDFNRFTNSPLANYKDELYNLPFNMNTFHQLWGCKTPAEAMSIIDNQRINLSTEAANLEEKALSLVGHDIYNKLIKGYTEKQWGRKAKELPAFIINRIPLRFIYDNNYFSDRYQGIPVGGYTQIIEKMLVGVDVKLGVDFLKNKEELSSLANQVIFTGPIDAFFEYCYGKLEYRSLRFESETYNVDNFQGNAVINYTDERIPFTRIIEHKHFDYVETNHTVVTKEYPIEWDGKSEPYYPINDQKNMELYKKYRALSSTIDKVKFGGRLAEYKYYDMHQVIRAALNYIKTLEK
ncbi:UDP-galactopyranose mutase [Kosakonia cowanii]|nr:UDP-galactopyranose mutase [Enterobacter cloacae]